jgi:hypothetical protein
MPRRFRWVGEVAQDELGLHEPAVVLQRGREAAAALLGVQPGDKQARGDGPVVQRPREAKQLVPLVVSRCVISCGRARTCAAI